ncbi:MAG: glycosyltransferase [Sphingopyxis sp.]|nr:glycosyltransferase [Sphingopyxis sp.]
MIIPHYNDLARLDRCLAMLVQQTYPAHLVTIIVADNQSPQGTDAVERVIAGRARLVIANERGAGPARNSGVANSDTDLLAFIDADCVPEPQWLASGLAGLDDHDFCGGPVHVLVEDPDPWSPAQAFEAVFAFDNAAYVRDKGFTVTANLFTRRDVFDVVGAFANGLSEDLDWCHRARDKGFRLGFVPAAAIGHPARKNWGELSRKWLRIQAETYALNPPTLANKLRWLARSWAMPLSIIRHAPRIWSHPQMTTGARRRTALLGLIQLRLWRWRDGHRLVFGLPRG